MAKPGRLLRAIDFESVLASPIRARSVHFAAHHLARSPTLSAGVERGRTKRQLSTGDPKDCAQAVDDHPVATSPGWWFGAIVPKRHARRATTRNLLRRQIRGALERHHRRLPHGMWLVRLRAPFDTQLFRSAAAPALRVAARNELEGLLLRAAP